MKIYLSVFKNASFLEIIRMIKHNSGGNSVIFSKFVGSITANAKRTMMSLYKFKELNSL